MIRSAGGGVAHQGRDAISEYDGILGFESAVIAGGLIAGVLIAGGLIAGVLIAGESRTFAAFAG